MKNNSPRQSINQNEIESQNNLGIHPEMDDGIEADVDDAINLEDLEHTEDLIALPNNQSSIQDSVLKLSVGLPSVVAAADLGVIFSALAFDPDWFTANQEVLFQIVQYASITKLIGESVNFVVDKKPDQHQICWGANLNISRVNLVSEFVNTLLIVNAVSKFVGNPLTGPFSFEYVSAANMFLLALKSKSTEKWQTALGLATNISIGASVYADFIAGQLHENIELQTKEMISFISASLAFTNVVVGLNAIAEPTYHLGKSAVSSIANAASSAGRAIYSMFASAPRQPALVERSDEHDPLLSGPSPYAP